ncbi:protein LURP-one-related 10-like [Ananas comosus]|uniref:Protein LURP-one-related 10-like n=1 Tax=Ananas comosus TaxID=4615 RepID=A0A6P5EPF6_ANACO|nr:protein LURP-one-related 10-like [Ananas comosus]
MDVASASSSLAIVGPQYCAPYPLQLIFAEKAPGVKRKNLAVTDIFGNLIFRTEKAGSLFAHQRVIVDAATGYVILSAEKKMMNLNEEWHVFRGNSFDPRDLLFTVQRTAAVQIKTDLNVFLATNMRKDAFDFKVEGSYYMGSCKISSSDSSVIAEMSKEDTKLKKGSVAVSVDPNTDFAFVAALMVIRHEFHVEGKKMIFTAAFSGGTSVPATVAKLALRRLT